ncbi:MAG: hydrophobic protein [Actinobacteria bacterium]|nr:hydrophobic protein [Actinomycetota bacterium]
MLGLILFFLLVALVFGLGFATTILFYVAIALFIIWIIGIFAHGVGHRWYFW